MSRETRASRRVRSKGELPEWPEGKPVPAFKSAEDEERFWQSHSFADVMDSAGELLERDERGENKLKRPAGTRRRADAAQRTVVYRLRLSVDEMELLKTSARRRGIPASEVVRELIRGELGKKRQ